MKKILLIDLAPELIGQAGSLDDGVSLESCPADAATDRLADGDAPAAVVIGPDSEAPIRMAQQIHSLRDELPIILVVDSRQFPVTNQMVKVSPFLGNSTHCIETKALKNIHLVLDDILRRSAQRMKFREIVAATNSRLQAAVPKEQQTRRILDSILYNAPVGIVLLSRKKQVVAVNQRVSAILVEDEKNLTGQYFPSLFPEKFGEVICAGLDSAVDEPGKVLQVERCNSGTDLRYLELTTDRINPESEEEGFIVILNDVTEKVEMHRRLTEWSKELEEKVGERTEELRMYSQLLEEKNRELEQYNYIASHDLQEPLRTVTGYLSLLQRKYSGTLDEEAREYIGATIKAAGRMRSLIGDLLSYSRIGKDRHIESVDTDTIVRDILRDLDAAISESGAEIFISGLPAVDGVELELKILFQNLVNNAIKFRRAGETPKIYIKAERSAEQWVFSVCDNGIGIRGEHLETVFTLFKRLHSQSEYPGTGIGLAICRKIVELHGGRIWVESKPGSGSCFYFSLPDGDGL